MTEPIHILILEDDSVDAELNKRALQKAGIIFDSLQVDTLEAFSIALDQFYPDIVLADYQLVGFNGLHALAIVREKFPLLPFIVVTGAMGEELAVETIKKGATDYILKDRLARLPAAVTRALEEKKQQQQRREAEEKFRTIYESSGDAIILFNDGMFFDCNDSALRIFGCGSREELINKHPSQFSPPIQPGGEDSAVFSNLHIANTYKNGSDHFEWKHCRLDGSEFFTDVLLTSMKLNGKDVIQGTVRDITELKQAEIDLSHANRSLATLGVVNRQLVYATNEVDLLHMICKAIIEQRGYRMAWVGYVQHDNTKSINVMAYSGYDEGFLNSIHLTWDDSSRDVGQTGRAILKSQMQVYQDIANDSSTFLWRAEALTRGYASSIALPLMNGDNEVFGVLTIYSVEVNAFTPGEIDFIQEIAGDLSFGVRSLRIRHQRDLVMEQNQKHLIELQNSLEKTVRAIANLVELRDPYTAGHQIRVADLAMAIAGQMGLTEEQVTAIHLAGMVHDVGKIHIPAEILSKPGALNDIEYSLIKTHAQAGYEILKDIDFPWPVARIVLQHHEHLDGTGYPNGLKGNAIMLESRILSVADVLEAMSSHRPYRPALGIPLAVDEITRYRGTRFDPAVVDAALTLFRDFHYSFKDLPKKV